MVGNAGLIGRLCWCRLGCGGRVGSACGGDFFSFGFWGGGMDVYIDGGLYGVREWW